MGHPVGVRVSEASSGCELVCEEDRVLRRHAGIKVAIDVKCAGVRRPAQCACARVVDV